MAGTTRRRRRKEPNLGNEVVVREMSGTAWVSSPLVQALEDFVNMGSPEGIAALAAQMVGKEKEQHRRTKRFDLPCRFWYAQAARGLMEKLGFVKVYRVARQAAQGKLNATSELPLAEAAVRFAHALEDFGNLCGTLPNENEMRSEPPSEEQAAIVEQALKRALSEAAGLIEAFVAEGQRTGWRYFRLCPAPSRYRLGERCHRVFLAMPTGRPGKYCSDACRIRATRALAAFHETSSPAE